MNDERWKPVSDGRIEFGLPGESFVIANDGMILELCGKDVSLNQLNTAATYMPDDIRLCEFVPDEPITPDALRRAGWKDAEEDECVLVKRIDDDLTCYFWNDLEGKEHFEVVYAAIIYPGVRTVQDLLTLSRFLGGNS